MTSETAPISVRTRGNFRNVIGGPRASGTGLRQFRGSQGRRAACDRTHMPLLIMLSLAAAPGKWDCGIVALVTRVFDGDTVEVAGLGRVRLLGIDAPEIGGPFERPAPFALEARDELQSLLLRRWARFDCDSEPNDAYGRRLAYVTLETGEFINARLVRDGLARVSARRRLQKWDELRQAEAEAQRRQRGMWGDRPRMPPESYRLRRRRRR
jgi:endonuclease YncB( thermonuclease family)